MSRAHPSLPQTEMIDGVQHIRVPGFAQPRSIAWLKFLDLVYSLRVRRALPKADILVTNTFWLPLLVRNRSHGLIYVHVARGPKGQMRWYRNAARLQAVSRAIGDAIITQAPEQRAKVRVLPNALPFTIPEASPEARQKTILFVGRIHPEKGLELLLRALHHVPRELLVGWKIKFIGPHETGLGGGGSDFLNRLQTLAAQSGTEVEWHKAIFDEAELSRHYQRASIFVYPSLAEAGEAMPLAPLEAMANGCVPLVSNLDCFRDYIEDGSTGFVFDYRHGDPEKNLTERLIHLLRLSREEIDKIGAAARTLATQFSADVVAERYLDDFASLLAANEARVRQYDQTPA